MKKFPACFPDNFETEILPKEAKCENKPVYRIIKSGIINRDSFLSTYEETMRGLRPQKGKLRQNDPGLYSTSCFMEYEDAQYWLNIFMRKLPKVIIAEGETEAACGPCQLTSEREEKRTDSHLDWWIYEKTNPQDYFREVQKSEE